MRLNHTTLLALASFAFALEPARAELPLPDATLYGKLVSKTGAAVTTGVVKGTVQRGAAAVLTATGEFRSGDGDVWYVLKVPMETNIGAPGPNGTGAREGDALGALLLDGKPVTLNAAPGALKVGSVTRIDGTVDVAPPGGRFRRGDSDANVAIELTDAVSLLNYLFTGGAKPACLDAADFDDSGEADISDAVANLNFQFLGGKSPAEPGPTNCGADPNVENPDLGCDRPCE